MATSEGPVHNSSDLVKDFCCEPCEEHSIEESAMFYCKICKKLFCGQCVNMHSQLYAKHTAFGRGDMSKWPLTKKTLDLLQKCGVHKDKTIEMFCQDHSHLCCTNCVLINHRQCNNVALISESRQTLSSNPKQMSDEIQAVQEELKKLQDTREADTEYVEVSYQERLKEVRDMRQKINAALDKLEKLH